MLRYRKKMTNTNLESTLIRLIRINKIMKIYNLDWKPEEKPREEKIRITLEKIRKEYFVDKLKQREDIYDEVIRHEWESEWSKINDEEVKAIKKLLEN